MHRLDGGILDDGCGWRKLRVGLLEVSCLTSRRRGLLRLRGMRLNIDLQGHGRVLRVDLLVVGSRIVNRSQLINVRGRSVV